MKAFVFILFIGGMYGQTVSGQTTTGAPPQTATAIAAFKKVPKLVLTLSCPGVPQDASGNYLVVAGSTVSCTFVANLTATSANGASVAVTSSDTTQITVPTSVVIPQGATVSAAFNVTATP